MLSCEQKVRLLQVARQALQAAVTGQSPPDTTTDDPALNRKQGAFVTLKKDGQLRGCIGCMEGTAPLIETVADMARSAALSDPRFEPVRPDELAQLSIEISVLTPLEKVADAGQIQVGRDGLMITSGYRRGVLLPQVPLECGWDRDQFLAHTCLKAGLPADAWKSEVLLERFEAEVFGEESLKGD